MKAFIQLLIFGFLFVPLAAASQYSEYIIEGNAVLAAHIFDYKEAELSLSLPKDSAAISLIIDGRETSFRVFEENKAKKLSAQLNRAEEIKVSYITKEFLERPKNTFFVADIRAIEDSDLTIKVVLPERASLVEPIEDGSGSIYPKPSNVETDGRSISFYWEYADAIKGQSFPILIEYYEVKQDYSGFMIAGLIAIVISIAAIFVLRMKKLLAEAKKEAMHEISKKEKKEKKLPVIEFRLKEDEKAIIRVLKLKNGSTSQSTLRIATGFPKATLSRLLMELEARNMIIKEKKGNKNLIILKSSVWNDLEQKE